MKLESHEWGTATRQQHIDEAISRINFAMTLTDAEFSRNQIAGAARNMQSVICKFGKITDDSLVKD